MRAWMSVRRGCKEFLICDEKADLSENLGALTDRSNQKSFSVDASMREIVKLNLSELLRAFHLALNMKLRCFSSMNNSKRESHCAHWNLSALTAPPTFISRGNVLPTHW